MNSKNPVMPKITCVFQRAREQYGTNNEMQWLLPAHNTFSIHRLVKWRNEGSRLAVFYLPCSSYFRTTIIFSIFCAALLFKLWPRRSHHPSSVLGPIQMSCLTPLLHMENQPPLRCEGSHHSLSPHLVSLAVLLYSTRQLRILNCF